jgi:pyrroloquinoline quinone biosynthesis protein B
MSEIPHPFVVETMRRFAGAGAAERAKIRFIHLNRTNPALFDDSDEYRATIQAGFRLAIMFELLPL